MGRSIEAIAVSTHSPSLEHPYTPPETFRNILSTLNFLQEKKTRLLDIEADIARESQPRPEDPLILNLYIQVPNDPENPNRVILLPNFRFLGFQLDESKTWYALFQSNEIKFSNAPFKLPIFSLGVTSQS